jgi:predicted nucleotidyltransferase
MSQSDTTIRILQAHADELRARGVAHLALFGSTLHDEARADSDIDLLVDFDAERRLSLIDYSALRLLLCDLLGRDVDLVQRNHLKPHLRDIILDEARAVL